MDAVQTSINKTIFFLASAVVLIAPRLSVAQTLSASPTTVTIGSSSCNNSQAITVGTTVVNSPVSFSVAVKYPNGNGQGDANGPWVYATVSGSGTTSTSNSFTASTGTSATTLTIGLNRSIGAVSDTAEVDLTDLTNPGDTGSPIKITVFYTQNTSCGGNTGSATNGTIIVTPGNVSLTTGSTGQTSQTLSIQNTSGSAMTFTPTVNPSNSWLSVTYNSATVSGSGGTTPITVTGDATKVASTGTYTGIVTITPNTSGFGAPIPINVTFVVTSGSGTGTGTGSSGTLTLNGATSNTYNTSFNEIGQSAPGALCIPLQDSAAGASSYSYSVTTSSGGNWLLANFNTSGTTPQLLAASFNACVTVSTSNVANSLTSGAYQGSIALTSSSGSQATINVTLNVSAGAAPGISVTPGLVYTFPNQNAGATALQQQLFQITAQNGVGFGTATPVNSGGCTNSTAWFTMNNPTASGNVESFTVTANPTGLTAGVYCQVITMSSTGNGTFASGTTYITVILPIAQGNGGTGSGGGNTQSLVEPTQLTFLQQTGTSFWTGGKEAQSISVTGPAGSPWSASLIYGSGGSNWLTFDSPSSGTFGNGPVTIVLDLFNGASSLPASNTPYTATVDINTPGGTIAVSVSMLITPSNTAVLLALPATATFSSSSGNTPTSQTVQVVGSDNTGSATSPPISLGTPTATWITASTNGGNTMTINVNAAGLSTGLYYGTIPVTASAYANTLNFPVVLVVNGGGGGTATGPLTLSSTSLSFSNVTGSLSQTINVTDASGSTNVAASTVEQTCSNATWLTISPGGSFTASTTNTPVTVTVNPSGINNGTTCNGLVSFQTSTGTQQASVAMTVGSATGSGNVTVSPLSMTFTYTQGQNVPASQNATIVNAVSGTSAIPFTVTTSATWLQVSATQGQTPFNSPGLSVSVSPGSLTASSTPYTGTVTITPTGGTAVAINVTLTVSSNAVVTATPTNITLSYLVGTTSPTSTIQVSAGGAAAPFTAVAASSSNFLTVTPTSGTTGNTGTFPLTVGVNPSVLSTLLPNTYTGTVTISGTGTATGSTIVNVTLNVTQPLPQITGITNAASGASGVPVSPGEIISIFGGSNNPIGPATSSQLNSTTCPSPCTQIPTLMGGVQVKFLPNGVFAPLTFVSATQINAVVPYEEAGIANLSVEVLFLGQTSNAFAVTLANTAPGLFTSNGSGIGQAAAIQLDNTGAFKGYNVPSTTSVGSPAQKGWYLVLYMTGEGATTPKVASGSVTPLSGTIPVPGYAPTVLIGNQPATVVGYSEAPGFVSGVLQVNVLIPQSAPSGSAVPISVSLVGPGANTTTQANVTVAIQ